MKSFVSGVLVFSMIASSCVFGSEGPARKKRAAKPKGPTVNQQLQQMKDQLAQQQTQMQQQQNLIQQLQQQVQQNAATQQQQGQQVQQMQTSLQQVDQKATTAEQNTSTLNTQVADLKTNTATISETATDAQKRVKVLEAPPAIHYKGITLTPGGFLTADFLYRTRNENADMASSFGATPFGGLANSKLSEFRGSSRISRLWLLGEGKAGDAKLTGYFEMDFLSPSLANYVETNPWNPRVRQAFGQVDLPSGFTVTAGQYWSLITTDRKGIATRAEFIPNTIEASYVIGYNYVRQAAVRVTKNFNDRAWFAVEVANPETTVSSSFTPAGIEGFNTSANASSPTSNTTAFVGGTCTAPAGFVCNPAAAAVSNGMSTNLAPDLLAKIAFEPGWGHYEIKGIGRFFRDRLNGVTRRSYGAGVGAAAILPIVPKKVDVIAEGLVGEGIGRYGAGLGPDVTLRPDGKIIPVKAVHVMFGLEAHPTPKLDFFAYAGDEYYGRSSYVSPTGGPAGYGSPLVNVTNCGLDFIPTAAAPCGAQNKNLWEGTAGYWYRFYKGPYGTFQWGVQGEYLYRTTWAGINTGTARQPKGMDTVVFTALRYFIP